jgi:two-component system, chemotaxis family, protein-glutamate methylesterase/glutaminase
VNSSGWPANRADSKPIDFKPVRILVVDDSRFARKIIRMCLDEHAGFEVVGEADNGQTALDAIRALHPDVISMDLDMPVMDGLTMLRELREFSSVPVVVVSGLSVAEIGCRIHACELHIEGAVTKTFSEQSLDFSVFSRELAEQIYHSQQNK